LNFDGAVFKVDLSAPAIFLGAEFTEITPTNMLTSVGMYVKSLKLVI
jgi:hypothetical protein